MKAGKQGEEGERNVKEADGEGGVEGRRSRNKWRGRKEDDKEL